MKTYFKLLLFSVLLLLTTGCSSIISTNIELSISTTMESPTITTLNTVNSTISTTTQTTTQITTKRKVQINFFLYEGKDMISITSEEGNTVSLPLPSRKGYTFLGWQLEENYGQEGFYSIEIPDYDLNLYAIWEVKQFNVKFYDNNNQLVETFLIDYDSVLADIDFPDFFIEGYIFVGFYLDENREQLLDYERMPDFDISLYAKNIRNTFYIRYLNYDGEILSETEHTFGSGLSNIIIPDNPSRIGYSFIGWNIQLPETMPAYDIVIEPLFIVNSYTITFETNGGVLFEPQIYDFNVVINPPTNPTKEGYIFEGWYKDPLFVERFVFTTMPAENITLYAKWITNFQYLFSYFVENGTYYSDEFGAGYEITNIIDETTYEFCVEADGTIYLSYIFESESGTIILQLSYKYNEFSPFGMILSISVESLYVYGIDYDATYNFDTTELIFQFDENTWGVLISEEEINNVTEACFFDLILYSMIYFELIIGVPFQ